MYKTLKHLASKPIENNSYLSHVISPKKSQQLIQLSYHQSAIPLKKSDSFLSLTSGQKSTTAPPIGARNCLSHSHIIRSPPHFITGKTCGNPWFSTWWLIPLSKWVITPVIYMG